MSRIYLVVAFLFVLAGIVASFFAPTENMGSLEAFYARLILIAPPLFVGTVISALALIMRQLEQLIEIKRPPASIKISDALEMAEAEEQPLSISVPTPARQPEWKMPADVPSTSPAQQTAESENDVDFNRFFASKLREPVPSAEEPQQVFAEAEPAPVMGDEQRRAPTVDEYLEQDHSQDEDQQPSAALAREGTFAGRSYRMYDDGSLEIDTEQSTIRFESLDEFRAFVSTAQS
ncbi:MAG: hypothetical protein V4691_07625 [Pseudomonadota bacterium]